MDLTFFQQQKMEELKSSNIIMYKEICEILDAFQIASGQGFAIGKTKALLDYLKNGSSLIIQDFEDSNRNELVLTAKKLAEIYTNIDPLVDLPNDKNFVEYFV